LSAYLNYPFEQHFFIVTAVFWDIKFTFSFCELRLSLKQTSCYNPIWRIWCILLCTCTCGWSVRPIIHYIEKKLCRSWIYFFKETFVPVNNPKYFYRENYWNTHYMITRKRCPNYGRRETMLPEITLTWNLN